MSPGAYNPENLDHEYKPWFGPLAGAVAFSLAGFVDWVISSRACFIGHGYLGSIPPGGVRWILAGVTFVLFVLAAAGAVTSYRDWHRLAHSSDVTHAEATAAPEFIAMSGLFVSAILAFGVFWMGLPMIFLDVCMRAH